MARKNVFIRNITALTAVFLATLFLYGYQNTAVQSFSAGEFHEVRMQSESVAVSAGKININEADSATLQTVPGIGEVIAGRIIDYREENGPFTAVEDLRNVKGIGEKTLEKLLSYLCV